jgi:ribonuclease P protein component
MWVQTYPLASVRTPNPWVRILLRGRQFFPKSNTPGHTPARVCWGSQRHLYLPFASRKLIHSGAGIFNAETHISTQPAQALEEARVPDSHEDQERGRSAVAPPGEGTQARLGETGFPRVVDVPPKVSARCQYLVARKSGTKHRQPGDTAVQNGELVSAEAPDQSLQQRAVPEGASFPRTARLLKHSDFEHVYKQGRRHFSSHMTVFYLRQAEGEARVGLTVGRVLGGAVQRNRIKRRLREAVRRRRSLLKGAVDVVINPKKSVLTVEFPVVLEEVSRAFGVITKNLVEK